MSLGGSPAGASTNQPRAGASVYTPSNQGGADTQLQSIFTSPGNIGDLAANPGQTPAGLAYPIAQGYANNFLLNNPGFNTAANSTGYQNALGLQSYNLASGGANQLTDYAQQIAGLAPGINQTLSGYGSQVAGLAPQLQGYAQQVAGLSPQLQGYAQQVASMAPGVAGNLNALGSEIGGAIPGVLQASMDPQNALYSRTLDQLTQQASAQNALSGLSGTPYGQDVLNEALGNFNINWQNNQLQRMLQGLSGAGAAGIQAGTLFGQGATIPASLYSQAGNLDTSAGGLLTSAGNLDTSAGNLLTSAGNLQAGGALDMANLLGQSGNLYSGANNLLGSGISNNAAGSNALYNLYNTFGTGAINAENSLANLGQQQFTIPQQAVQDLESYLGLGQSASTISGQLGQLGQNQLSNSLSGIGGALGAGNNLLFGSSGIGGANGLLGSGGALSGLFGGSSLPASSSYFAPLAGTLGGVSDFAGGADLLGAGAGAAGLADAGAAAAGGGFFDTLGGLLPFLGLA